MPALETELGSGSVPHVGREPPAQMRQAWGGQAEAFAQAQTQQRELAETRRTQAALGHTAFGAPQKLAQTGDPDFPIDLTLPEIDDHFINPKPAGKRLGIRQPRRRGKVEALGDETPEERRQRQALLAGGAQEAARRLAEGRSDPMEAEMEQDIAKPVAPPVKAQFQHPVEPRQRPYPVGAGKRSKRARRKEAKPFRFSSLKPEPREPKREAAGIKFEGMKPEPRPQVPEAPPGHRS